MKSNKSAYRVCTHDGLTLRIDPWWQPPNQASHVAYVFHQLPEQVFQSVAIITNDTWNRLTSRQLGIYKRQQLYRAKCELVRYYKLSRLTGEYP